MPPCGARLLVAAHRIATEAGFLTGQSCRPSTFKIAYRRARRAELQAASGKVSIFEIAKILGNSATICERRYAAYLPGAHDRIAGALDGDPGASAPQEPNSRGAGVTPEVQDSG